MSAPRSFGLAMVCGWRALISRNCAPAMELQSPQTVREIEEYLVELLGVTVFESVIVPDINRGVLAP